jgi:hypothetical protein
MRRILVVSLLAVVALLAGCLGVGDPATEEQSSDPVSGEASANRTLYLHGEDQLAHREPAGEPERVPAGSFYTAWAQGEPQPTWTGSALDTSLHVSDVELTFFYTAESATATTGPQDQGFPEFVVYLGTEQAPMAWASVEGPDVVQEGEVVNVRAELSLPAGGLVLPEGVEPVVKLAPVQGQGSAPETRIEFLVNGTETPSRAELAAEAIELGEVEPRSLLDETGTLAGSAYALGADEQTTADTYEIDPEGLAGLEARLERVQGAGIADIDLELLGAEDEVVARSVTPEAVEGLALREPNVAAVGEGPWTLRVVNYGNAAVEYELTATALDPAG